MTPPWKAKSRNQKELCANQPTEASAPATKIAYGPNLPPEWNWAKPIAAQTGAGSR